MRTATALVELEKTTGGDRAAMELWFGRAMRAGGDNRGACWAKLDWLDPKWHGTPEEMLAFGQACAATKNWQAGITLLACDAHNRMSGMIEGPGRAEYLGSPEVWSEIKSIYDEYLKHYPSDAVARSKYASLCCVSEHFVEVAVHRVG